MPLTLVTAPAVEPITEQEALDHLRVSAAEDLIDRLITAARQHIDGKDGWLGRALITQIYDLYLDGFPSNDYPPQYGRYGDAIYLPLPPLQEVASVKYIDTNGDLQTMDAADYAVYTASEPAFIRPAYGTCWPSTRCVPESVVVRFTCGYGDAGSDVPMPIKQWLLLKVAHLYENREMIITGTIVDKTPFIENLLSPFRIWP